MVKRSRARRSRNPKNKRRMSGQSSGRRVKRKIGGQNSKPILNGLMKMPIDGPKIIYKSYKTPKHDSAFEAKVIDAMARPINLVREEFANTTLTRSKSLYHFWNIGTEVDLLDLAKNASPIVSGVVSQESVRVLNRTLNLTYSNITGTVDCKYDAYWVTCRSACDVYPVDLMVDSTTYNSTGTTDQFTGTVGLDFTKGGDVAIAGTTLGNGISSATMFNVFAFRNLLSEYKVVKTASGNLRPGKDVAFDLAMKPCMFNPSENGTSAARIPAVSKRHYIGLIIKFTGELSYTDTLHGLAEHGVHLQLRAQNCQVLKQYPVQSSPYCNYLSVGKSDITAGNTGAVAMNDESDEPNFALSADTNAKTF